MEVRLFWQQGFKICVGILFCLTTTKVVAEDTQQDLEFKTLSSIQKMEVLPEKVYELTLENVTALALENNFSIQLAKYQTLIARTDYGLVQSIHDTFFKANIGYRDNRKKQGSTILGDQTVDLDHKMGVTKKLSSGTTLGLDMMNNMSKSSSIFAAGSKTHESTITMNVKQELGVNIFGLQDRGKIDITKLEIENMEYSSLETIEEDLTLVQKVYWDLVLVKEQFRIEDQMLKQAERLFVSYSKKYKDGLVERPDVLAAEANFKRRENQLILTWNHVKETVNRLKFLLNIAEKDIEINPTQVFSLTNVKKLNLETYLEYAFKDRRDYKRVVNDLKERDIVISLEKNNIWPEINLVASIAKNGLDEKFINAQKGIFNEDNNEYFVGVEVSVPLENKAAKSKLKVAELEKAKRLVDVKSLEKQMTIEVKDGVRNCNVFLDVAVNQEHIAALQAEKLEEEVKRFQRGRSDIDTLIRFQEDVIQDRLLAAQAKHRYYIADVDLKQKLGGLLNEYWQGEIK